MPNVKNADKPDKQVTVTLKWWQQVQIVCRSCGNGIGHSLNCPVLDELHPE